jgi:solute carrier family 30 (zinc transporter), member 9
MKVHGTTSVLYALAGNSIIACLKLFGYILSGSSSLFAEAVHSFADTANQFLLYVGLRRSVKQADEKYSYGYGGERFFWALVSACGVLFVGAGITIYHGLHALFAHEEIQVTGLMFGILAASFLIESFTLYKAIDELLTTHTATFAPSKQSKVRVSLWQKISRALAVGDPITVAVIYEDTAAVLGVVVASLGLALTSLTHSPVFDAIGALFVGAILAIIAVVLINKNRQFLLRKSIPLAIQKDIIEFLEEQDSIDKVIDFKSSVLDVGKYHIKCEVEWNTTGILNDIKRDESLRDIHERVSADFTEFKRLLVDEAERIPRLMGREIDAIEKRITTKFPHVAHIDIEIN